jgi:hypothetical protein
VKLSAHQSGYLPGLRLLAKIATADMFCHFDIVKIGGGGFESYNYIKAQQGPLKLTVPIHIGEVPAPLSEIQIAPGNWRRKHKRSIQLSYAKAPYFDRYWPTLEFLLSESGNNGLSHLNLNLLRWLMGEFEIKTPLVIASDYDFKGTGSALVLDMCKRLGATHYIFGSQGRNYADVAAFNAAGITVEFQDYQHPTYNQLHGPFIPNMSALDLLFNHGPESRKILMGE